MVELLQALPTAMNVYLHWLQNLWAGKWCIASSTLLPKRSCEKSAQRGVKDKVETATRITKVPYRNEDDVKQGYNNGKAFSPVGKPYLLCFSSTSLFLSWFHPEFCAYSQWICCVHTAPRFSHLGILLHPWAQSLITRPSVTSVNRRRLAACAGSSVTSLHFNTSEIASRTSGVKVLIHCLLSSKCSTSVTRRRQECCGSSSRARSM